MYGGAGKTALAIHVAHHVRTAFPDGQLYLNLRGTDESPVDVASALDRFLRDLGVPATAIPATVDDRASLYRTVLVDRKVLVVLDNARDAAQIRPLLPGSGSCGVLITSRQPLPDLAGARPIHLGMLTASESRTLFDSILGADRAAAEPDRADAVLDVCGGLPLAIRIAAGRLTARPEWTVAALADRLADQRRRLDELTVGDLAVRASFAVSYDGLPADTARVFRLLGLVGGPSIGLPAAAALVGRPTRWVESAMELLVDTHLLGTDSAGHYRAHDLLRLYAADLVNDEEAVPERLAAIDRMLTWYTQAAAAAAAVINPNRSHVHLDPPPPEHPPPTFTSYEQALAWLEAEHLNLVAAVHQAVRYGRREIAWQLPIELWDLFSLRSMWPDCVATYRAGISAAAELGDARAEAWLLNNLSGAYDQCGRSQDALECLLRALELNRQRGDRKVEGTNLYNLSLAYAKLSRPAEAMDTMRQALEIHREIGYRYGEGMALNALGELHRTSARESVAIDHFRQALAVHRAVADEFSVGITLRNICDCQLILGQVAEAEGTGLDALAVNRRIGHWLGEAQSLLLLGDAARQAGRTADAGERWRAAAAIFERIGHEDAAQARDRLATLGPPGR